MTEAKPFLRVQNLHVHLPGRLSLRNLNWQISTDQHWAILGPNGVGKTSLANVIAGKLPAAGGSIVFHDRLSGQPLPLGILPVIGIVSADMHRRVFEREDFADEVRHFSGVLDYAVSVRDYITDPTGHQKPDPAAGQHLTVLSERLGLKELLNKSIASLSTGEISKMLILGALVKNPQLLILDEPFNGMDPQSIQSITDLITKLMRQQMRVILITHRREEIVPLISHVMLLSANGIEKYGPKPEMLRGGVLKRIYGIDHDPMQNRPGSTNPISKALKKTIAINQPPPAGDNATPLVEMIDVSVRYGALSVFHQLNWTVRRQENWHLFGPEGSGKTSLLKLITGENLQAYANHIVLFGKKKGEGISIWELRRRIGWVSSDLQSKYAPRTTGAEVVLSGFFGSVGLYRPVTSDQRGQVNRWLEALGLSALADKPYGRLSHGQKQMLIIVRAMVTAPLLLLLDEPCDGLDFANRHRIEQIIDYVGRHTDTAIVYATSDRAQTLPCITHRIGLDKGRATISKADL